MGQGGGQAGRQASLAGGRGVEDPKGSTAPQAADARNAAKGIHYQVRRCKRAEEARAVGRLLVSDFQSGTSIGQVALRVLCPSPNMYDPDDISRAGCRCRCRRTLIMLAHQQPRVRSGCFVSTEQASKHRPGRATVDP